MCEDPGRYEPRTAVRRPRKITSHTLRAMRERGDKVVLLTAYDYPTAVFAERAGVDVLLVGDSAAMTMMGFAATTSIGMKEMLVFVESVCRAAQRSFVIGDLPFLSYQTSDEQAIVNAGAFITLGCDAVKCEGGARSAPRVRAMTDAGIAVMGHLGLTPQNLGQLGGYRVQARTRAAIDAVVADALALEEAGAFALLLEGMPAEPAAHVRSQLSIPVYGIGAGPDLDGQLVISHDILGNFVGDIRPRFVRRYAAVGDAIERAIHDYSADVRAGRFPAAEHCYAIDSAVAAEISTAPLEWSARTQSS